MYWHFGQITLFEIENEYTVHVRFNFFYGKVMN